jgi:hypothetical protein
MILKKPNPTYFIFFLIVGLASVYLYFGTFLSTAFSPYYGDEFFYVQNAKAFFEEGQLAASFTYSGFGSAVGGFDAHGPAYPLLYGGIHHLAPIGKFLIPILHLIIFLVAVFLIILRNTDSQIKLLQTAFLLGSPFLLFYSFSWMPELIHFSGAVGLYLLIEQFQENKKKSAFFKIVCLILILGAFRSTWFLALVVLPILKPDLKLFSKILLGLLALGLPFLFQKYLTEQVPNVFSELMELLGSGQLAAVFQVLYINTKRNIYFLLTYSEGYFYWVWKIWVVAAVILGLQKLKHDPTLKFGITVFLIFLVFSIILYKTYKWTEWRMLTPMAVFISLRLLAIKSSWIPKSTLLGLSLLSFTLILPFQKQIIQLRSDCGFLAIPESILTKIKDLEQALILIDSGILNKYEMENLPISTKTEQTITYILPYYEQTQKEATHILVEEDNQLIIFSTKILPQ